MAAVVAVLVLGATFFAACIPARALSFPLLRHEDRQHKEIESLEAEWRGALVRNDDSTLNRLLADDYLGVNPDGTLETKADALALRRSGALKITRIDPDNIKIHVYGDTAVVSSLVDVDGQEGERDISGRYHYTRVYRRRAGLWKVVSFEASRLQNGRNR